MDFFTGNSVYVYLFIFFGKVLEVSAATVRNVLINRGERTKGTMIAMVEIMLWITVTGTVLAGFTEDILKVVLFCIAFALGNFIGSWLESKLALGLATVQIIMTESPEYALLTEQLRQMQLAVTVTEGMGKEGPKKILLVHLKRNRIPATVKLINSVAPESVLTVSDLKIIRGGFIKK